MSMHCPICGQEVMPDDKNPGKYLCRPCLKRYNEAQVVVKQDEPEPMPEPANDFGFDDVAQPDMGGEYPSMDDDFGMMTPMEEYPQFPGDDGFTNDGFSDDMGGGFYMPDGPSSDSYSMDMPGVGGMGMGDMGGYPGYPDSIMQQDNQKKKGGKGKVVVILIVLLLVLGIGAVGVLWFLGILNLPFLPDRNGGAEEAQQVQVEQVEETTVEEVALPTTEEVEAALLAEAKTYKELPDPWKGWFWFDNSEFFAQETTVSDFIAKTGWHVQYSTDGYLVNPLSAESGIVIWKPEFNARVTIDVVNRDNAVSTLGDCYVTGIRVETGAGYENAPAFRISKNVAIGMQKSEVIDRLGQPSKESGAVADAAAGEYAYYMPKEDVDAGIATIIVHYNGDVVVGVSTETYAIKIGGKWVAPSADILEYIADPAAYVANFEVKEVTEEGDASDNANGEAVENGNAAADNAGNEQQK